MFASLNSSLFAQNHGSPRLEALFAEAMEKDGFEYGRIREEILSTTNVVDFLLEKTNSKDVYERVIGRAMLTWRENAATNEWLVQVPARVLAVHSGNIVFPKGLACELFKRGRDFIPLDIPPPFIIVMQETALKGTTFESDECRLKRKQMEEERLQKYIKRDEERRGKRDADAYLENERRNWKLRERYVKSIAAGLSGTYDDPDVPVFLEKLFWDSPVEIIRECAMVGMGRTSSTNLPGILLDGLDDTNESVRETANWVLWTLTGENGSGDRARYQEIIVENRVAEALPRMKEYIDAARRGLDERGIGSFIKKRPFWCQITRDGVVVNIEHYDRSSPPIVVITINQVTGRVKDIQLN